MPQHKEYGEHVLDQMLDMLLAGKEVSRNIFYQLCNNDHIDTDEFEIQCADRNTWSEVNPKTADMTMHEWFSHKGHVIRFDYGVYQFTVDGSLYPGDIFNIELES